MEAKTAVDHFGELLSVLSEEELIRIRYRLRKAGKVVSAEVLTLEIKERLAREALA